MDAATQNIINGEAYFSGQADLHSTVEKIQNRVTLFLQESFQENPMCNYFRALDSITVMGLAKFLICHRIIGDILNF